ncbi:MAG: gamma-glutamyltransferase family protein [Paracoccaceae bacterium]
MLAGNAGAFAREPLADADSLRASPEVSTGIGAASRGFGRSDMVVAAHPAAVAAARDMLESGGGAVDAAIAAQMVLNLVEPQSSGIGGGGFLLHSSPKDGRVRVYDGRETAPAGVGEDLFLLPDGEVMGFFAAVDSGLSVGVPGLLRMLEQAHRDHGRLPWERLFEPAIDLARAGFPVSPRLHRLLTGALDRIRRSGSAARHYLDAAGRPWPVGHLLRDPEFADTLAMIAAGGADAFYRGSVAAAMVEAVRGDPRGPGRLAMTDLAGYRAVVREPVCGPFRGLRVCGAPPPSSGGITLLQSLGIFERLEPVALAAEPGSPMPAASMHRLVEAYRLAYADRSAWIADPDFFPVPRDGLLDAGYLGGRAKLVDDGRSMGMARAGQPPGAPPPVADPDRSLPSTTHLAIVDRHGEAVSLTSSIEHAFGNLLRVRGFLLNNQLTDFALSPVDADGGPLANRVEASASDPAAPWRRPSCSTMMAACLPPSARPAAARSSSMSARHWWPWSIGACRSTRLSRSRISVPGPAPRRWSNRARRVIRSPGPWPGAGTRSCDGRRPAGCTASPSMDGSTECRRRSRSIRGRDGGSARRIRAGKAWRPAIVDRQTRGEGNGFRTGRHRR